MIRPFLSLSFAAILTVALGASAFAEGPPPAPKGSAKVRADAATLLPMFPEGTAKRFMEAATQVQAVPAVGPRVLAYKKSTKEWLTLEEAEKLPFAEKANWAETTIEESQFYETKYGSPLVYARVLEIANKFGMSLDPLPAAPASVLDFGYGTIGHLQIMGAIGIETTGIDVDPFLEKLYALERAAGRIACLDARTSVALHLLRGQWPAEQPLVEQVRAIRPQGFDLITSKNTLKNGYLHPTQPVDEKKLVKLGVSDIAFVQSTYEALRPGGLFIIYNISPRPSTGNEPYKPWADGRCPFSKEMLQRAGFEVLDFDVVDDAAAESIFKALGYPIADASGQKDLFALYTVCRRPPG